MRSFFVAVTTFFVLIASSSFAETDPWAIKLPFETAIIKYDVTGNEKGTETLYLRKGGKEMVRHHKGKGKILFISTSTNTIEIVTAKTIIMIDMDKETGVTMTNPQVFMKEEYAKLTVEEKKTVQKNIKEMGMSGISMVQKMGGSFEPKADEHLGYECDVISFMGTTICQMSGTPILLKQEGSVMGIEMKVVATEVKENVAVSDDLFEAPAGIDVTFSEEQDEMNRKMARQIVAALKDPEAGQKIKQAGRDMQKPEENQNDEERFEQEEEAEEIEEESDDDDNMQKKIEKGLEVLKGIFN